MGCVPIVVQEDVYVKKIINKNNLYLLIIFQQEY
jgi:hypothetical protein